MPYVPILTGNLPTDITTLRKFHKMSQRAVCRATGDRVSSPTMSSLERGDIECPDPKIIRLLATALEVPYLALMFSAGYVTEEDLEDFEEDPEFFKKLIRGPQQVKVE